MVASFALTGCGGNNSGEGDKVTIEVGVEESYVAYYEDVTAAYTAEHPEVEFKVTAAKMFDILDALEAQKGNSADIFMLPNDRIGDLAQKKLIAPINADLSGYTETAQTAATFGEDTYFVPLSTDTTLLFYNKSLTDKVPATLKEIDPATFAAKWTDFYCTGGMFASNGAYIFGDSNTDVGLANEGALKAGEAIKSLYSSGHDHWEALKEEGPGYEVMVDKFVKGELTYIIDGPWKVGDFVKDGMDEANIGAMPIPSWDGTADYAPLTGTKGVTVNAYSDVKEEAIKFVQSLANVDSAKKWFEDTKEVNPHTGIVYEEGSLAKTVLDATAKGTSMPTDPAFGKCWVPMADALKNIANGGDVKESLEAAVNTIVNDIKAMTE